jgi:hypothetical protein
MFNPRKERAIQEFVHFDGAMEFHFVRSMESYKAKSKPVFEAVNAASSHASDRGLEDHEENASWDLDSPDECVLLALQRNRFAP